MAYLQSVPKVSDMETLTRGFIVVTPDSTEVVYVDESASRDAITAALTAWGLRVREERQRGGGGAVTATALPVPADSSWQTTRPSARAPGRLANDLSPVWLPTLVKGEAARFDAAAGWAAWFGVAA